MGNNAHTQGAGSVSGDGGGYPRIQLDLPSGYRSASNDHYNIFELNRIIGTIRRRKLLIFLIVAALAALTAFIVFQLKPMYKAQASVVVEGGRQNVVDLEDVVEDIQPDFFAVHTEAAIVTSREVAERTVTKLNLTQNPDYLSYIGLAPAENGESLSMDSVVDAFQRYLTAVPTSNSRVIDVRFNSTNPEFAALAVNTVSSMYIEQQLEVKSQATIYAGEWLETRADELREKMQGAETKLQEFKRDSGIIDLKGGTIYEEQLAELNLKLIEARNSRAESQARVEQIRNLLNSSQGVDTAASVLSSPLIQELRQQEAMVERNIGEMTAKYRDSHPTLKLAYAEHADLQRKIREEVNKIAISLTNELEIANVRENNLENDIAALKDRLEQEKEAAVILRSLQSDVQANRELYSTILSRFKETGVQETGGTLTSDSRIISYASVPKSPFKPNRPLILFAAIIMAFIIAIGVAIGIEFSMAGYHSGSQIEHELEVPVLAMLPQIDAGKKGEMPHTSLLHLSHNPLYSESMRNLRSSLLDSRRTGDPKVILITSSVPDEGKTSTVFSLATISRLLNQKCLLIDCDLRRSHLARRLDIETNAGLGDYLSENAELRDILYKDNKTGVYFIPAGRSSQHPLDLLGTKRMEHFMDGIRGRFDYIFIDSPPLMSVTDTLLLTKFADYILYIVRWEKTARSTVQHGIKLLREQSDKQVGVAMSRVDIRKHAYYHYTDSDYVHFKHYSYTPSA